MVAIRSQHYPTYKMNRRTNLAVDTLVKGNTKTPPVDLGVISISFVHFRGKVGQGTGLACERLSRSEIRCDVLQWLVPSCDGT